jgi:hypothetical protein
VSKNWSLLTKALLTLKEQLWKLAFMIIHSTTLLLPTLTEALENLKLANRIMLRDVWT